MHQFSYSSVGQKSEKGFIWPKSKSVTARPWSFQRLQRKIRFLALCCFWRLASSISSCTSHHIIFSALASLASFFLLCHLFSLCLPLTRTHVITLRATWSSRMISQDPKLKPHLQRPFAMCYHSQAAGMRMWTSWRGALFSYHSGWSHTVSEWQSSDSLCIWSQNPWSFPLKIF